jgi:hypothetical protein
MRLGKEQAAGYVEDTEADEVDAEQLPATQPDGVPLTASLESPLTVR